MLSLPLNNFKTRGFLLYMLISETYHLPFSCVVQPMPLLTIPILWKPAGEWQVIKPTWHCFPKRHMVLTDLLLKSVRLLTTYISIGLRNRLVIQTDQTTSFLSKIQTNALKNFSMPACNASLC